MSISFLIGAGFLALVVGILGAIFNAFHGLDRYSNRSLVGIFIVHGVCALFYITGLISMVTGIVMYLINYTKG